MIEAVNAPGPAVPEVLVDVVRSDFVEGHHHGSLVALDPSGQQLLAVGDVTGPVYPRSCNKPVQATGMLACGLDLPLELVALCGASHSGEPFHLDGVRRILASAGLDAAALRNPPDFPLDDTARLDYIRAGHDRAPIAMNCSGKHAGMLATCVVNGWPTDSYRDPDHPLQQRIAATFEAATGEPIASTGVDGCGAPLFATSLVGLATAFSRLVRAADGTPEHRVASAFIAHPTYASGTHRDEAALLRAIPGAVGKAGAEGCYALALPDGRAIAFKIDDGAARARPAIMVAALRTLGVLDEVGVDGPAVLATGDSPLYGGGRRVGELRVSHPALAG